MTNHLRKAALTAVAGLATATLATTLAIPTLADPASASAAPDALPGGPGTVLPDHYLGQSIDWRPCFPDGPPEGLPPGSDELECGSFTAPRDWADPAAGNDITIAVSRLAASDGDAEGGALFTNPGGPGAPGRFVPLLFLLTDRQRVLENQDIYGIDVRGAGGSTSASCDGGAYTGITLDPRDRSQANTDLILDSAALVTRFCQNGTGEFGPFVRTDQTVYDLDLLRHLIGQEKINWLGYSGGTWLGAHYATYFPDRVGRFVLDANVGFTDPWQAAIELQPLGFQRRFEQDFQTWAAQYDAVFGLGATPEEVNKTYEDLRAELAAEPLDFGYGFGLYAVDLDWIVIGSMYTKVAFQPLAELIGYIRDEVANRGEPENRPPLSAQSAQSEQRAAQVRAEVEKMREIRARSGGIKPMAPDSLEGTFLHILCNDTPTPHTRESLLTLSERLGQAYPLAGWSTLSNPCITWNRPDVMLRTPTGAGVPPILMVQNDRDPATPIEGALRARDGFADARLLTVTDEGDHTTYMSIDPNKCVDDAVEDYLVGGVVPERDSSCPGNPIPPPMPSEALLPFPEGVPAGTPQQLIAALTALASSR